MELLHELILVVVMAALEQDDVIARARALAVDGRRSEAIALLQQSVADASATNDARVLLGTVLSWERRYKEARRELDVVLLENPDHGDALLASISVEFWSNDYDRAERLLARLLEVDPNNEQGKVMSQNVRHAQRRWRARVLGSYDSFSDDRAAWREVQLTLARSTPVGTFAVIGARAERFGLQDHQVEIETYPRFARNTNAYIAAAYSPTATFYPKYRYAVDLNQGLGAGFEASAGFRRLGFGDGVTIYVASLSKYQGPWLITGRAYVSPDATATSRSYLGTVRRYLGQDGTYAGLRYGRGGFQGDPRTIDDFEVLNSHSVGADAVVVIVRRLELQFSGTFSREDRANRQDLRQYSVTTGLGWRF